MIGQHYSNFNSIFFLNLLIYNLALFRRFEVLVIHEKISFKRDIIYYIPYELRKGK